MNKCVLCMRESELRKSHIIPEWAYSNLYDTKHRQLRLSMKEDKIYGLSQQGVYEYLLCGNCEVMLSKYEGFARNFYLSMKDGNFRNAEFNKINHHCWLVKGIDYAPLKMFYLSILFRACISTDEMFKYYTLSTDRIERLRFVLYNETLTGIDYYPIVLGKPFYNGIFLDNVLLTQSRNGLNYNCEVARFMFMGIYVTVFLDEQFKNMEVLSKAIKAEEFLIHRADIEEHFDPDVIYRMVSNSELVRKFYDLPNI